MQVVAVTRYEVLRTIPTELAPIGEPGDCRTYQAPQRFQPDLIFTHYRDDRHQDHRLISDLTWNTFRDHLILEYEIPKYDGDLGQPNLFVPLSESTCIRKRRILVDTYRTQAQKHWFDEDLFMGLMRLRGMEANSPTRFAEGFYCRKAIFR